MTTGPRLDWEPSATLRHDLQELADQIKRAQETDPTVGDAPLIASAFGMGLQTGKPYCYRCESAPIEIILPVGVHPHSRDRIDVGLCRACAVKEGAVTGDPS